MAVSKGTTTIRIRSRDKERLVALRDKWRQKRGEDVSQQELVSKAIAYAERHLGPFLEEAGWQPWSAKEIQRLMALRSDWGTGTLSTEIDDIVYGDD